MGGTHILETITINSKKYPKYLPEPAFIDEKDLLFKRYALFRFSSCNSYYAPEYDNFKQLFKAHISSDDFYICIPSKREIPVVRCFVKIIIKIPEIKPTQVNTSLSTQNAFSADYHDEVVEFMEVLNAGKALLQGHALLYLQKQLNVIYYDCIIK